jgi:predicted RNase H-like HicB family nuclease
MRNYIGLLRKEAGSDYGVSFPDFPGIATAGTNLDDARARRRRPWPCTSKE